MRPTFRPNGQASARARRRRSEQAHTRAQKSRRLPATPDPVAPSIVYRVTSYGVRGYNPHYLLTTQCRHGFQEHELGGSSRETIVAKAVKAHKEALNCDCNGAPQAYSSPH